MEGAPEPNNGSLDDERTAAELILRSLNEHGVEYMFGDYGTDHTPLLEAAARIRESDPERLPETVICPDEAIAMGAAHGYAVASGDPQALIVHVDVGTQNLGAMMHNAHRANAPAFILAGLTPLTETGFTGSKDIDVHYLQGTFHQADIVREYTRWFHEFRAPEDPDKVVVRGLERASTPPRGPVYVTAAREPLEAPESELETSDKDRSVKTVKPTPADSDTVDELSKLISQAEQPLLITSKFGLPPNNTPIETLVEFAEAAGAGVVEQIPNALCFPRDHELHVGFDPLDVAEESDLVVVTETEVPWNGSNGSPPADVPVVQLDNEPTKALYPHWDFRMDRTIQADPEPTLAAVTDELDSADGAIGREHWQDVHQSQEERRTATVQEHRRDDRFTPEVLTDALNDIVDDSTVVVAETVTNSATVLNHLTLSEPESYHTSYGSGLGWSGGAPVGVKMAHPHKDVISLVGDGAYITANPLASLWLAVAQDAPFLTVVYNNSGWNAVKGAVTMQHPAGESVRTDVPESEFEPGMDFADGVGYVDAYGAEVTDSEGLLAELEAGLNAVDDGMPAIIDAKIEPI